jgi:hypothetical protein
MAKWHYYNESGDKIEVTGGQLKGLAKAGMITPDTIVETEDGKKARAGKVKGLTFIAPSTPAQDTSLLPPNEVNVAPSVEEDAYGLASPPEVNPFTASIPVAVSTPVAALPPTTSTVPVPQVAPPPTGGVFCTNCGNAVTEQAVACMSCGCKPIGHKKFCYQCGVGLNPEQIVCVKCGSGLTATSRRSNMSNRPTVSKSAAPSRSKVPRSISPQEKAEAKAKTLGILFNMSWIGLAVGFPLMILAMAIIIFSVEMIESGEWDIRTVESLVKVASILQIIAALLVFVAAVSVLILLYQLWKLIPEDIARTTPSKAIGFWLIPFFNLYWNFVAIKGLGEDMNATLEQHGVEDQVNARSGSTFCILVLCSLIPFIGALCGLISIFVLFSFLKSVKNGAIVLLEHRGY